MNSKNFDLVIGSTEVIFTEIRNTKGRAGFGWGNQEFGFGHDTFEMPLVIPTDG